MHQNASFIRIIYYMDNMDRLFEETMLRIRREKKLLTIKRRIVIFSVIFIGSIIAFVPVFHSLEKSISESGFMQFLSLFFSDFKIVAIYWQSFALSLLETLPVLNLAIFLVVVLALLESVKFLAKDIKFFLPQHSHN